MWPMSVEAQGGDAATSRGVEEDILVPLLARLTAIGTLLESAATPPPPRRGRTPPPAGDASAAPPARDAAAATAFRDRARAQLEKVRAEMAQLELVFRHIDDAERRVRHGFDPVERHLDDALQHEPADAERIHAGLLAVDAGIAAIKESIRDVYNLACVGVGGGRDDETLASSPPARTRPSAPGTATAPKVARDVSRSPQMDHLRLTVGGLDERRLSCVLCLAAFPEGAVIKKRLLIHWWMGEGFVRSAGEGKRHFDELAAKGFVVAAPATPPLCGTAHRCTVQPWMRDLIVGLAKRHAFLDTGAGDDLTFARRACLRGGGKRLLGFGAAARAIYNVGQKYVELTDRWLAAGKKKKKKKKDLRVLQLGQWREFSAREQIANPMASHVEISGVARLRELQTCKSLRYLSFRGISGIESLPDAIGKLRELVVLDLRACHNLEELGHGITKLDRLEYLDVSECYLLVGMPKGLGQLTRLEILKGFVVASSNSREACHLNELTKLEKVRKLGIVIGKMAVPLEDEFLKLAEFKALESLKISWGTVTSAKKNGSTEALHHHSAATMKYALPPNLKKLDLHCFPLADFAQWVRPAGVKKLYIRGGRLSTLGDDEGWEAEVLRLRFLSDLRCDHVQLRRLFPKLKPETTEIHDCPNFIRDNHAEESAETSHSEPEEIVVCNEVAF